MKRFQLLSISAILLFFMTTLSSCQAIADIFGAGFKVGIWVAVIVVILIIVIIAKVAGGKK